MLVEADEAAPNLGLRDVVSIAFDDAFAYVLTLIDIFFGSAAVHSASHVRSLMAQTPVMRLLDFSRLECVVNNTFHKNSGIGLESQTSIGFDYPAHSRTRDRKSVV